MDKNDVPPGWVTYRYAAVMEALCVLPAQLAGMTDHQLDALCFHPRTAAGALKSPRTAGPPGPPPVATAADKLGVIDRLEADRIITPQRAAELRAKVNGQQSS